MTTEQQDVQFLQFAFLRSMQKIISCHVFIQINLSIISRKSIKYVDKCQVKESQWAELPTVTSLYKDRLKEVKLSGKCFLIQEM